MVQESRMVRGIDCFFSRQAYGKDFYAAAVSGVEMRLYNAYGYYKVSLF